MVERITVRQDVDVGTTLDKLARLLRRRFARTAARSFVMLAATAPPRARVVNTDNVVTQPLPVFIVR